MRRLLNKFRKSEAGHASIEFVIMFPIFFVILLSAIDVGMLTLRGAMLERALDIVVRDIRLSTGTSFSHADIRDMICDETNVVPNCKDNLKLEMIRRDLRNWSSVSNATVCTNSAEETQPVSHFETGMDNELMILRACAKFTPMFGDAGISSYMKKDSAGDVAVVTKSAFVQEPR